MNKKYTHIDWINFPQGETSFGDTNNNKLNIEIQERKNTANEECECSRKWKNPNTNYIHRNTQMLRYL